MHMELTVSTPSPPHPLSLPCPSPSLTPIPLTPSPLTPSHSHAPHPLSPPHPPPLTPPHHPSLPHPLTPLTPHPLSPPYPLTPMPLTPSPPHLHTLSLSHPLIPSPQMKVTGKNLLNVCKLLFSLARESSNDSAFQQEGLPALLVLLLRTADLHSDAEALVYGVGTVKLLASTGSLRESLAGAGVLELLTDFMAGYSEVQNT